MFTMMETTISTTVGINPCQDGNRCQDGDEAAQNMALWELLYCVLVISKSTIGFAFHSGFLGKLVYATLSLDKLK